jgi:NADH-ubiquinone oxidoreductase chain 5
MINLIALDMLMSIGFFAVFSIFGSLNYSEVFSLVPYLNEVAITIIALFLLGGALAKSANIPLHSWLPGSMEATNYIKLFFYFQIIFLFYFQFIFSSAPPQGEGRRANA